MKPKIPQEIDALMWSVAESGNPTALAEFEQRYPEHIFELGRRLTMMRELKGAKGLKGSAGKDPSINVVPRFQPRPQGPPPMAPAIRNTLICLGVAGTLVLAYLVTLLLTPEPARVEPAPSVSSGVVKPPEVVYVNPKPNPGPTQPPPPTNQPGPQDSIAPFDPFLKPTDMEMESAPLKSVLQAVSAAGRRKLTILEGLANPDIKVSYRAKSPLEMLKDLGKLYAFTPMDQGDGSIVIVPARDENEVDDPNLRPTQGNKPTSKMQ